MNDIDQIINSTSRMQIHFIGDIPAAGFTYDKGFLVKNITEENIIVTGKLINGDADVTTVIYPGWNVEVFKEINAVTEKSLQYGY